MKKILFIASTALVVLAGCKSTPEEKESPAPVLDMKTFFKNGEKSTFRISPDGNYFSYRADYKGKMNVFVQKATDTFATRVTNDTLRSIGGYFWKGSRIVYIQDIGGDETFSCSP
jgi:Tol biopolymer transport system component